MIQAVLNEYEDVEPEVLRILDPEDELLLGLVHEFEKTRNQFGGARVVCFFELRPSNVKAIIGQDEKKVRATAKQS